MIHRSTTLIACLMSLGLLAACSSTDLSESFLAEPPKTADVSVSGEMLRALPPPAKPIAVSVYEFRDETGQHKPNDGLAEYSRAVTQGGASIIAQALVDAGNGNWFTVLERNGLENLIQERKIIRATRDQYVSRDGRKLAPPPPLLYSGMLIEGGIIAYESNVMTGGLGAKYLGIGGNSEYRRDIVTVYLRAVNVSNGQIILSTNASKTIFSTALQGGVFKFIGVNELLEIEGGFSLNEPPQFAVRQAIEMAVYSMVMEGTAKGVWGFADKAAQKRLVTHYLRKKQGEREQILAQLNENMPVRAQASQPAFDRKPLNIVTAPADFPNAVPAYNMPPPGYPGRNGGGYPPPPGARPSNATNYTNGYANGNSYYVPDAYTDPSATYRRPRPDLICNERGCVPIRP